MNIISKMSSIILFAIIISSCAANRIHNTPTAEYISKNKPGKGKGQEIACISPKSRHSKHRNREGGILQLKNHQSAEFAYHAGSKKKYNSPGLKNNILQEKQSEKGTMVLRMDTEIESTRQSRSEMSRLISSRIPIHERQVLSDIATTSPEEILHITPKKNKIPASVISLINQGSRQDIIIKKSERKEGKFVLHPFNQGQSVHQFFRIRESLVCLTLLFAGFLSFLVLKNTPNMSSNISYWAAMNPRKARFIIGSLQVFAGLSGLFLGTELSNGGTQLSNPLRDIMITTFLASALLYPVRKSRVRFLRRSYFRQKIHDLLLFLSGFMLMVWFGNYYSGRTAYETNSADTMNLVHRNVYDQQYEIQKADHGTSYQQATLVQDETDTSQKKGLNTGDKVLLTILSIVGFCAAAYGIAAASCGLACSGLNGLAVAVAVVGGILVVGLFYWALKSIYNPKNKRILKPAPA